MEKQKIVIGSDHAGYSLKEDIKTYLISSGYEVTDEGTYNTDSVDYPVIAHKVAKMTAEKSFEKGILICGTGAGMCICANKTKGIRAVVCSEPTTARYSRLHNDSNILCLGSRIIGIEEAKDICKTWLETEFEGGRHLKRVNIIE